MGQCNKRVPRADHSPVTVSALVSDQPENLKLVKGMTHHVRVKSCKKYIGNITLAEL